ncbi:MAG: SHOCT domain-containing protein [Oscillospiraceae bacterium]|nr:SHOCT domain-containing protein [Oscillospiraceae bacterium]
MKTQNIFQRIVGILFLLSSVDTYLFFGEPFTVLSLLSLFPSVLLGISLLTKAINKKLLMAGLALNAISALLSFSKTTYVSNFISVYAFLLIAFIAIAKSKATRKISLWLWNFTLFVSPIVIIYMLPFPLFGFSSIYVFPYSLYFIFSLCMVFLFFVLYKPVKMYLKSPLPSPKKENQSSISEIGNADKILYYKELLDKGQITQEEFDEKKKQLLGL